MPHASLIICTRNRAARLPALFKALAGMRGVQDVEIVVVDSCSTDNTRACLDSIASSGRLNMKVLTADKPGQGYAQALALTVATGDPLIFTDDDCFPDKDFLVEMIKIFDDPTIGFAGGRIELYNPEDYPVTIRTSMEVEYYEPGQFIRADAIQGANMAFRRCALLEAGGFDPRFGGGGPFRSGNDFETVTSVSALGWRGGYFPTPLVYHDHGRRAHEAVAALERAYDYGRGAVMAKRVLDRRTRQIYSRQWYWLWRRNWYRKLGWFIREMTGAMHFMLDDLLLKHFRG